MGGGREGVSEGGREQVRGREGGGREATEKERKNHVIDVQEKWLFDAKNRMKK